MSKGKIIGSRRRLTSNERFYSGRCQEQAKRLVRSDMQPIGCDAGRDFDPETSTLVEWTLTARRDGGTALELRESGFRTELHHRENHERVDRITGGARGAPGRS